MELGNELQEALYQGLRLDNTSSLLTNIFSEKLQFTRRYARITPNNLHNEYDYLQCVKTHTWDQSNKFQINKDCSWSSNLSIPSKVCYYIPPILYIKHNKVRFQTSEEFFPNQFLHPQDRSTTIDSNTQWAPYSLINSLHKTYATSQWSNNWSTVSPMY